MTKVIVVGATGLVGSTIVSILEERNFPISEIKFLASSKSLGEKIKFRGSEIPVRELNIDEFKGFDLAFFAVSASLASEYIPKLKGTGIRIVDNSSSFRMDLSVPLVVPEVNAGKIKDEDFLIANPNCSTIQCIPALYQLDQKYGIERIVFSTYQSVSGSGIKGLNDLRNGTKTAYEYEIRENVLAHIDTFTENGYTKEEIKMIEETKKILGNYDLRITATTVRVPVEFGHAVSVNVELKKEFELDEVKDLFDGKLGMVLLDDPTRNIYPHPKLAAGKDEIFIGRIRRDFSLKNGLNLWIVADNIRKGAALNAVQIGECLV